MSTITICSSASLYQEADHIRDKLVAAGFAVLVPEILDTMREKNDWDVAHYKTWFADPKNFDKKTELMRLHFANIAQGDAILVVNGRKAGANGAPDFDAYIGANVLMEMAVAFYLRKKIFVWQAVPPDAPYYEEVMGMGAVCVEKNIRKITF